MLSLALALLFLALLLLWYSNRQRIQTGLPSGRIIYTDTGGWGKLEKPLYYAPLELTGKPDYLVQEHGRIIPVEVKSGPAPDQPYESHLYQLAAYCLLVEKNYSSRPPYGLIHYRDRDFAIDYTAELEIALNNLLAGMKRDETLADLPRSHQQAARCSACGFRYTCDQSLV